MAELDVVAVVVSVLLVDVAVPVVAVVVVVVMESVDVAKGVVDTLAQDAVDDTVAGLLGYPVS